MLKNITSEFFLKLMDTTFQVRIESGENLEMTVSRVTEFQGVEKSGQGRTPFSVEFLGPLEPALPQRIYRLESTESGVFEIFLVPVGIQQDGMVYEAVFN